MINDLILSAALMFNIYWTTFKRATNSLVLSVHTSLSYLFHSAIEGWVTQLHSLGIGKLERFYYAMVAQATKILAGEVVSWRIINIQHGLAPM